jgi:GNAT superfamily N-acetyltransferase
MAYFTLRRATRDDQARLGDADPRLASESGRADHVATLLDLGMSWLAEVDGAVAGYALVSRHFYGRTFVDLVVVAEAHRRRGVAGALMAAAEDDHDDDRLFTSTNESNSPMRTLLAGRGYQVSGLIENLDPGDPELVFVKFKAEPALATDPP